MLGAKWKAAQINAEASPMRSGDPAQELKPGAGAFG
jgi:hypothetical protein